MTISLKSWWQGLKYWQKGGVVGAIISVIFIVLSLSCIVIVGWGDNVIYCFPIFTIFELAVALTYVFESEIVMVIMYFLLTTMIYTLFGALIGLIIGKVEGRKNYLLKNK